jgi:hypothetical protein
MQIESLGSEDLKAIDRNCDDFKRYALKCFEKEICYNDESIKWLDWLIESLRAEALRKEPDKNIKDLLMVKIGSFLGEAIIAKHGGEWVKVDGNTIGTRLHSGTVGFPFGKVVKHFRNGTADSILGLYYFPTYFPK